MVKSAGWGHQRSRNTEILGLGTLGNKNLGLGACVRRTSETPTTITPQRSIAIHLQFVFEYTAYLYCGAFGAPTLWGKGNLVSIPPICIAVRLPFRLQCASHSYRSAFGKILVVAVTGMIPNLGNNCARNLPERSFCENFWKSSAKNAAKFWRNFSQIFVLQFPGKMAAKDFTKNRRHFPRCTKLNFFTAATLGALGPKEQKPEIQNWKCSNFILRLGCACWRAGAPGILGLAVKVPTPSHSMSEFLALRLVYGMP